MYAFTTLDPGSLRHARRRTTLMTAAIFGGMVTILYLCASLVVGDDGVLAALAMVVFVLMMSATPSARLVMRLARAAPVPRREAPDLYADLAQLSRRAGLTECPTLWWIKSSRITAFAAGQRGGAGIAVSDGAFRTLSRPELISVLAHEVAHLAAGDTRLMTLGVVLINVTQAIAVLGMLASVALLTLTGNPDAAPIWQSAAPCLATPAVALLHLGLSRNREFAADLTAAKLTGDAVGLARALDRLDRFGRDGGTPHRFLRTHPPTAERVARLLGTVRLVTPGRAVLHC